MTSSTRRRSDSGSKVRRLVIEAAANSGSGFTGNDLLQRYRSIPIGDVGTRGAEGKWARAIKVRNREYRDCLDRRSEHDQGQSRKWPRAHERM